MHKLTTLITAAVMVSGSSACQLITDFSHGPAVAGAAGADDGDSGGSGGDEAVGGKSSKGGSTAKESTQAGGTGGTGRTATSTKAAGGATSTGGSSAIVSSTTSVTCADGFTGTDCSQCLVVVNTSGGIDTSAGIGWATALATVQAGLDLAAAKIAAKVATACEVWVAKGTYYPTIASSTTDARTKTILLQSGVGLYGGFAGTETTRGSRDIVKNTTTLSGDIGIVGTATDNAYHVVTGANSATLDGFTVRDGYADGASPSYNGGGGMYNNAVSPTVSNCTFTSNTAVAKGSTQAYGGGMYNNAASPTVTNCTFKLNAALGTGYYAFGGGMSNVGGAPKLSNCAFADNKTTATYAYGAGLYNGQSATTLSGGTFTNNTASGTNVAEGGGMANTGAAPTLTNCTFYGNQANGVAMGNGGAISDDGTFTANMTVTNCTIANNAARMTGSYMGQGGSMGGGIKASNGTSGNPLMLANSIIWGNTATVTDALASVSGPGVAGNITLSYSNVQGTAVNATNHVISQDPFFAAVGLGDLHLQASSPCIDAAYGTTAPALDKDGLGRLDVTTVANTGYGAPAYADMGAYEFYPPAI